MTILRTNSVCGESDPAECQQKDVKCKPAVSRPLASNPFLLPVPDYIQADWQYAMPRCLAHDADGKPKRGRKSIGEGLRWAIHQAVIVQKSSQVVLPDVLLAQILWGGDRRRWDANWRRRLLRRLKRASAGLNSGLVKVVHREGDEHQRGCPPACPLHGTSVRHHHLEVTIRTASGDSGMLEPGGDEDGFDFEGTFLGALEVLGEDDYPGRTYNWNPGPMADVLEDELPGEREAHERLVREIKGLKREGRLAAVYFPLKLFGASPLVGLTYQQLQLHTAITRELTRGKGKRQSGRADRGEVLLGGRVDDDAVSNGVAPCPYLESGRRYVSFNGNGKGRKQHLRGRGYKLSVWMRKAAYLAPDDEKGMWRQVRLFLRDVERLADLFGLAVAAWHPKECQWQRLSGLTTMSRTSAGRTWLRGCLLRVYTAEDFLVRWRRFFAERMGCSCIPDPVREQVVGVDDPVATREAFLVCLNQKGVSQAELARQLGVSRAVVSYHLSGKRKWSAEWQKKLSEWVVRESETA